MCSGWLKKGRTMGKFFAFLVFGQCSGRQGCQPLPQAPPRHRSSTRSRNAMQRQSHHECKRFPSFFSPGEYNTINIRSRNVERRVSSLLHLITMALRDFELHGRPAGPVALIGAGSVILFMQSASPSLVFAEGCAFELDRASALHVRCCRPMTRSIGMLLSGAYVF